MKSYKGYLPQIEYDDSIEMFTGRIAGIQDVIMFEGKSVSELKKGFHEAVDDYLEWCEEEGCAPQRPCSGRFNLRISPELHQKAISFSKARNVSLNTFVAECIARRVQGHFEDDASAPAAPQPGGKKKQSARTSR